MLLYVLIYMLIYMFLWLQWFLHQDFWNNLEKVYTVKDFDQSMKYDHRNFGSVKHNQVRSITPCMHCRSQNVFMSNFIKTRKYIH